MPSGDLHNSRARLKALLRSVQYPHALTASSESASVADLLRVLHFALLDYSRGVAAFVQSSGYDLYGKTDARFVDCVFRLLRDAFKYFPSLSAAQFLSEHHWERKLDVVADVLQLVIAKHAESARLKRQQHAVWSKPNEPSGAPSRVDNHLLPPATTTAAQTPSSHAKSVLQLLRSNSRQQQRKASAWSSENGLAAPETTPIDLPPRCYERSSSSSRVAPGSWTAPPALRGESEALGATPRSRKIRVSFDQEDDADAFAAARHRETWSHDAHQGRDDSSSSANQTAAVQQPRARSSSSADLAETLAALSSQLAGLSGAFMTKISSIEDRLSRLEQQMRALSPMRASECDCQTTDAPSSSLPRGFAVADSANKENEGENRQWTPHSSSGSSHTSSEAANRLRAQIEPCAWPPKPAAFARV